MNCDCIPGACLERYVDDIFSIVLRNGVDRMLAHLNGIDDNIKFTIEQEEGMCLPFLDVSVRREEDGSMRTVLFRKDTQIDRA